MNKLNITLALLLLASCAEQTIAPKVSKAELEDEKRYQHDMVKVNKIAAYTEAPKITEKMKQRFANVVNVVGVAGEDLCHQLQKKKCNFDFQLEEDKALNAFADGKKIVINTAMMDFASKDEELANVVSHEYAHNIMRHVESAQGNMWIGLLAGLAIDTALGTGSTVTEFGAKTGAASYSVDFEKEADYVGLYIFARTGYDPNQAIEFWRKMSYANESAIDTGVTHPTNPERFVAMKKTIAEITYKHNNGLPLIPELKD